MSRSASLQLRQQLVDSLRRSGALHDDAIAQAFLTVPRELFVPGHELVDVYRDQAITTKVQAGVPVSSSSQPAMMAMMLEQLDVRTGMRVLEIGSGTGYNAALLRVLTGESGDVISLEIDAEIAAWARDRLSDAGYDAVDVIQTDGGDGWPAGAPYDRIELTVGTANIAPAWVNQLNPGGILVVPFWINTVQLSIAFEKGDRFLRSRSILPCGFTRIRGRLAGADQYRTLQSGVMIATGSGAPVDDRLRELLNQSPSSESLDGRSWHGFAIYMALHERSVLMMTSSDEHVTGFQGVAFGLVDAADQSLCLLTYPVEGAGTASVLSYGGTNARARLGDLLDRWRAAGSPDVSAVEVSVHPLSEVTPVDQRAVVLETGSWRFVFRFGTRSV